MTEMTRALVVVLVLAAGVFVLAKPVVLRFASEADFIRRRNVWFLLTVVAFLSPGFWWYALIAAPVCYWAGRKDSNVLAFYLAVLYAAPVSVEVPAPMFGLASVLDMGSYRLLSLVVLLPTALRLRRMRAHSASRFGAVDVMVLGYLLLNVVLFVPVGISGSIVYADSATNMARRVVESVLDVYLVYYVASRQCADRKSLLESFSALCLSAVVLAMVAMFESAKSWLLYRAVADAWSASAGVFNTSPYLMRGDLVRASAAVEHALSLGYVLALVVGLWLVLKEDVKPGYRRLMVPIVLAGGLLASFSRGPMAGAVVIWLVMLLVRPDSVGRALQALVGGAVVACVVVISPIGRRLASVIPALGGQVDVGNIDYRQRLAVRSWQVVTQHPWFGDQLAYLHLTDLRQGQGIIDFVNAYAGTAVFKGVVGVVLLFGGMLLSMARLYSIVRGSGRSDPGMARIGAGLLAAIVGVLLMLGTVSLVSTTNTMYFVLLGWAVSYTYMNRARLEDIGSLAPDSRG